MSEMGAEGEVRADAEAEASARAGDENGKAKKKRRQNVACDPCRLRRVKCDLTELLYPRRPDPDAASSSTPAPEPVPLFELVQQHPGATCTPCRRKGLKCTTDGIINPSRPNKGGRRIDEARRRFGTDADKEDSGDDLMNHAASRGDDLSFSDTPSGHMFETALPVPDFAPPPPAWPQSEPAQVSQQAQLDSMLNFSPSSWSQPVFPTTTHPFSASQLDLPTSFRAHDSSQPSSSAPFDLLVTPATSSDSVVGVASSPQQPDHVRELWSQLTSNPSSVTWTSPPGPSRFRSPNARVGLDDELSGHLDSAGRAAIAEHMDADIRFDPQHDRFVSTGTTTSAAVWPTPTSIRDVSPATTRSHHPASTAPRDAFLAHVTSAMFPLMVGSRPDAIARSSAAGAKGAGPGVGQKRRRIDDTGEEDDDWGIWAEGDRKMVRWTRKEAVQEKLADRALGLQLSRHLVKVFFHAVHLSLPTISPESFYIEWERAGHRPEAMTPAQETLCAVMEAWGARYSDSPVVLGLSPQQAARAPKVMTADGCFVPGTAARTHWGRARLAVCNALQDRARRLFDVNGIFRKPSVTGLQAMTLYTQLSHMTDQKERGQELYMESILINSAVIEQMRMLNLMWDSEGPIPLSEGEVPLSDAQSRMKQRRLFWTWVVSDAFWAAGSGNLPKIDESEIRSAGAWLEVVEERLPMSTFKALAFFMVCYYRLSLAARELAIKLAVPCKRPGSVDVHQFCETARRIWAEIKDVAREINVRSREMLASSEHSILGFSPVNYVANLRLSCPFLFLVLHQLVREQLSFRKSLKTAYIVPQKDSPSSAESSPPSDNSPFGRDVKLLDELHLQSVDILLQSCRAQTSMFRELIPTGMVQTAAVFLRVLIAAAQFLAEVPTVEQGYPQNTLGGCGWTWETKQKEVQACVDGLYQIGWAWADVMEVLDSVNLSMERMTPTPEELKKWQETSAPPNPGIVLRKEQETEEGRLVMEAALVHWPPNSIPTLIGQAMANLQITDDGSPPPQPSLDQLTQSLVPPARKAQRSDYGSRPLSSSTDSPSRRPLTPPPVSAAPKDQALHKLERSVDSLIHGGGEDGRKFEANLDVWRKMWRTPPTSLWDGMAEHDGSGGDTSVAAMAEEPTSDDFSAFLATLQPSSTTSEGLSAAPFGNSAGTSTSAARPDLLDPIRWAEPSSNDEGRPQSSDGMSAWEPVQGFGGTNGAGATMGDGLEWMTNFDGSDGEASAQGLLEEFLRVTAAGSRDESGGDGGGGAGAGEAGAGAGAGAGETLGRAEVEPVVVLGEEGLWKGIWGQPGS